MAATLRITRRHIVSFLRPANVQLWKNPKGKKNVKNKIQTENLKSNKKTSQKNRHNRMGMVANIWKISVKSGREWTRNAR